MDSSTEVLFQKMLEGISQKLANVDISSILYLCEGKVNIPKRRKERLNSLEDIWEFLQESAILAPLDTVFLHGILQTVNAREALQVLCTYETAVKPQDHGRVNSPVQTDRQISSTESESAFNYSGEVQNSRPSSQTQDPQVSHAMRYVADNIGRDWRPLVRQLGLTEADIDCATEAFPFKLREQINRALNMWYSKPGSRPSKDKLVEALKACEERRLAQEVAKLKT